jgi:parallel beta-helix repeat protein
MRKRLLFLALALTCLGAKPGPAPLDLYVAGDGRDSWSGTLAAPDPSGTNGPFATLVRARDEIRQWKAKLGHRPLPQPVMVWVRGGDWYLDKPFQLTAEDSGSEKAPIVYRAFSNEVVRLIGGVTVTGFKPYKGGILQADVADLGLARVPIAVGDRMRGSAPSFELFFRDQRQELARWPNRQPDDPRGGEWAFIVDVPPKGSLARFQYAGDRPARWQPRKLSGHEGQVHLWPWHDWFDEFVGIGWIDPEKQEITLAEDAHYLLKPGRRFYVRNVFEELDAPGEWYFDRATQTLYFWPPSPLVDGDVVVSTLRGIVTLQDTTNVMVRGFTAEMCRGDAVHVLGGAHNVIAGCTVRNTHEFGIVITGGRDNGATGNDVSDTGLGGISLGGGDRATLTPAGNYAVNNHIHHFGRVLKCYQPGVAVGGVGQRVAHNLIHDGPHCAIMFSGNEHVIAYNDIHHVCWESSDAGALYAASDWASRGNVIAYNKFHDIEGWTVASGANWPLDTGPDPDGTVTYQSHHYVWAVYLDDLQGGTVIEGNVFYRLPGPGIHIGGGQYNRVENNIFADCDRGVLINTRDKYDVQQQRLAQINYKQPPWSTRYPELLELLNTDPRTPAHNTVIRNIFVCPRGPYQFSPFDPSTSRVDSNIVWTGTNALTVYATFYQQPGGGKNLKWDNWCALGFDKASVIAAPLFVDAAADNYDLADNSPAFALGFKRIPVERIGLYPDDLRASWPPPPDPRRLAKEPTTQIIRLLPKR